MYQGGENDHGDDSEPEDRSYQNTQEVVQESQPVQTQQIVEERVVSEEKPER